MFLRKITLLLISILMLVAAAAGATALKKMDLNDLTVVAELIVRAEALSATEAFDSDTRRRHLYFTLKTGEVLKGEAPATFTVRLVAPVSNAKYAAKIAGQPEISVGGEYLLFLRRKGDLHFIIGMAQGQYNIVQKDGRTLALQKMPGVSLVNNDGTVTETRSENTELEYAVLKRSISEILKNRESSPQ